MGGPVSVVEVSCMIAVLCLLAFALHWLDARCAFPPHLAYLDELYVPPPPSSPANDNAAAPSDAATLPVVPVHVMASTLRGKRAA